MRLAVQEADKDGQFHNYTPHLDFKMSTTAGVMVRTIGDEYKPIAPTWRWMWYKRNIVRAVQIELEVVYLPTSENVEESVDWEIDYDACDTIEYEDGETIIDDEWNNDQPYTWEGGDSGTNVQGKA